MTRRLLAAATIAALLCVVARAQETPPPPAPQQPPEKPVEFPKDEPEKPAAASGLAFRKTAERQNKDRVLAALNWLRDHQDTEGYWSAHNFPAASARKEAKSTGNIEFVKPGEKGADFGWKDVTDIGLTGLSLLAFTANGYDHKNGDYKAVMRSAILYLRKVQDADGCFGPKEEDLFVYNHAIATTAIVEAWCLSGDAVLKPLARRAVDFILAAQNPGKGWRYGVKTAETDSSITGWMTLALCTAKTAGLEFDSATAFDGAFKWFDEATAKVNKIWRTGYNEAGGNNARLRSASDYDNNPTMDGIHGAVRLLADKAEGAKDKLADFEKVMLQTESLPKWEHKKLDYYYWFWGSMFLQQRGGKNYETWWKAVSTTLMDHQRGYSKLDTDAQRTSSAELAEHGSWDAVDAWSMAGGRVYATAMGALTLSMPWRFAVAEPATPDPKKPKEK